MTIADARTAGVAGVRRPDVRGAGAAGAVSAPRRPGRPRQEDIEQRVLDAVVELIDEDAAITVNTVVARSGVSRAAVYRRWDTMTALVAAALDRGRAPLEIPPGTSLRDAFSFGLGSTGDLVGAGYPLARLKRRVQLGLGDPELQRMYWESHVARRRVPLARLLQQAIAAGEVRADTDIDAVQDATAGVYYYQFVVRGESVDDPVVRERCRAAVDMVLRGIEVAPQQR